MAMKITSILHLHQYICMGGLGNIQFSYNWGSTVWSENSKINKLTRDVCYTCSDALWIAHNYIHPEVEKDPVLFIYLNF